jgi:1-acyl-sn-glycerol-3-phosphate acyltransferase
VIVFRSVVFNVAFYVVLIGYMLIALPSLVLPREVLWWMVRNWSNINLGLLRIICGLRCEFRGLENIPPGAVLVASKHQSLWETFALITVLDDPTYILKRELMWIPLFGWFAWKAGMIPVDRGARSQALIAMTECAREEIGRGRQIIIFPEGTRRAPGAEPKYKFGVAYLYSELDIACVPVALNSGLYWPRRSFMRYPGKVVVEFLAPLAPGLEQQVFFDTLRDRIETATARLVADAQSEGAPALTRPQPRRS